MFCRNCGAELPDSAKFCNQCGTVVERRKAASTDTVATIKRAKDAAVGTAKSLASEASEQVGAAAKKAKGGTMSALPRRGLVIAAAAIVAVLVIVLASGVFGNKGSGNTANTDDNGNAGNTTKQEPVPITITTAGNTDEQLESIFEQALAEHPYDEFVQSYYDNFYPNFTIEQVKECIPEDQYTTVVKLQCMRDMLQEAVDEYAAQVPYAPSDELYENLDNAKQALQKVEADLDHAEEAFNERFSEVVGTTEDASVSVEVDKIEFIPIPEEENVIQGYGNDEPDEGEFVMYATVRNDSSKDVYCVRYGLRAKIGCVFTDEYGDPSDTRYYTITTKSSDDDGDLSGLMGLGLGSSGSTSSDKNSDDYGYADIYLDRAFGVGAVVTDDVSYNDYLEVFDLVAGEERQIKITFDGRVTSKGGGSEVPELKPKGESDECWLEDASLIQIGEIETLRSGEYMNAMPEAAEHHVYLDPDIDEYTVCHDQVDIEVEKLEIGEGGLLIGLTYSLANNTGLYLDHASAQYLYFQAKDGKSCKAEGGVTEGMIEVDHVTDWWTNSYNYRTNIKPGDSCSDVEASAYGYGLATGNQALCFDCEPGEYTPDELGIVCELACSEYTIDREKCIEKGLLPSNWVEQSQEYKDEQWFNEQSQYLLGFFAEQLYTYAQDDPEGFMDLMGDVAGVVVSGATGFVNDVFDDFESQFGYDYVIEPVTAW